MRALVAGLLLIGSYLEPTIPAEAAVRAEASAGELGATPAIPAKPSLKTGLRRLGAGARAALLYVPRSYRSDRAAPLLVMMHGAGGSGEHSISLVKPHAERLGFLVLAPSSKGTSWDMISSRRYGPDVAPLDAILAEIFAEYRVDAERVAIGGFSDGASYALSLGLTNGKLFRRIIAFSPGFMSPTRQEGSPSIFISHGLRDTVLPIETCSRRIVPRLKAAGYDVDYAEFAGGHSVPEDLARRAYEALAGAVTPLGA